MSTDQDDGAARLREGQRVLAEAAAALNSLAGRLETDGWNRAVQLILDTPGRVVVTGMGKSGAVGRKLSGTLASTGTHALFLHPAEAVHGDLGMMAPGDTVIALSYSGETDEILSILPGITRQKIPIIALTANRHSTLSRQSLVTIDIGVAREACPLNLAPTTSTTVMMAAGDALAITVMVARGFSEDDYALLHPAGILGRRLTLRVSDMMRTGEALAVVAIDATVAEAVVAITRAHAGSAIVIDSHGLMAGLIVESDFRRHLLDDVDIRTRCVAEIMNRKPGTVPPEMLAVEALRMMDEFHPEPGSKVGEAPVLDANSKPIGMLTLKDLLQAGIATY